MFPVSSADDGLAVLLDLPADAAQGRHVPHPVLARIDGDACRRGSGVDRDLSWSYFTGRHIGSWKNYLLDEWDFWGFMASHT